MALYAHGRPAEDAWTTLPDDAPVPASGMTILPLARWLAERDRLDGLNAPLGVRLAAGDQIDAIVADLPRLGVIALEFPKYTDGRAFSKAALLRDRHAFPGELRAVGDVLWDQLQKMDRCGFDTFEIADAPTLRLLEAGRVPGADLFTQPSTRAEPRAGTRPWLRRRAV